MGDITQRLAQPSDERLYDAADEIESLRTKLAAAEKDAEPIRKLLGYNFTIENRDNVNEVFVTVGDKLNQVFRDYYGSRSYVAGMNHREAALAAIISAAEAAIAKEKELTRCASNRDGECSHKDCPQNRDGEPLKSGRHCPLDNWEQG